MGQPVFDQPGDDRAATAAIGARLGANPDALDIMRAAIDSSDLPASEKPEINAIIDQVRDEFKKDNITVEVLPKHLDEQVAALMVGGFGGVLTKLTPAQAKYINVAVEGPFKPDSYKY